MFTICSLRVCVCVHTIFFSLALALALALYTIVRPTVGIISTCSLSMGRIVECPTRLRMSDPPPRPRASPSPLRVRAIHAHDTYDGVLDRIHRFRARVRIIVERARACVCVCVCVCVSVVMS